MNIEVAKKRLNRVLKVDSIDSTESDFLATHVPFRNISVMTRHRDKIEETSESEEDIYRDIFENEDNRNQHQLVIVEGSSGAGKSHFIRWLNARLTAVENHNDVVLLIRRSDNTLKGTIRQLLDIDEVKQLANKEAYERLVRANQTITEDKFKSTIYHQFIIEIENDDSETFSKMKRKKLIALLNNAIFQDRMMSVNGPIERIYNKITNSSLNPDLDLVAQFTVDDLTLDVDFVDQLDDADKKARDFANSLMAQEDTEFIQNVTDYLNSFVETVIQTSAGIEPGDFEHIFKEIRQELHKQEKALILLVEDITSFTGINQALLNALIINHTGKNASDNMCRLISVVGTTSEYYRQFRDNYRDRINKQITIHEGAIGDNQSDLIQFVARYLNAVSLEEDVLDEWVRSGAYSDEMPIYDDIDHKNWDRFMFSSKKSIVLFPFTQRAILNLYESMPDKKTPRYIIRDIVEPAINEIIHIYSSFPRFCGNWRLSIPEPVENRIGNIVSSLKIPNESKAEYRKRLVTFIAFWTDKTLDITSDGMIAGVRKEIFSELSFDDFITQLTNTSTVKNIGKQYNHDIEEAPINDPIINIIKQGSVESDSSRGDSSKTSTVFTIDPKRQANYDSFKQNVISWHYDGGSLIKYLEIRDSISDFVYNTINWQQEEVPFDSEKRFENSIRGRLIGFERQDQGLEKCVIVLKDSEETYQLLLCFGKWLYLGNKSWVFPDSASAVYFATSWLERNKCKFVKAIRNTTEGSVIPAYIKAAMIEQVYKKILNGTIANNKSKKFGDETYLVQNDDKNTSRAFISGHSKRWYELHELIFSQSISSDVYNASVRYFNLIQGVQLNTKNYVLNYELYRKALKEIGKSNYIIDELELNNIEKIVKDKREIFETALKTFRKIHNVVEDELEAAKRNADEIIGYFDNFDMEDEIEEVDVKTILNDILNFYQKCFNTGINIGNQITIKSLVEKFKKQASNIAEAINIMKEDYSNEDDISILVIFSRNPIGLVLPFLEFLRQVNNDIDKADKYLIIEKKKLAEKGVWKSETDPRFAQQSEEIQMLYKEFEGVI